MEADSLNCCVLGEDVTPDQPEFALFIREVVREMTTKPGKMYGNPADYCAAGIG